MDRREFYNVRFYSPKGVILFWERAESAPEALVLVETCWRPNVGIAHVVRVTEEIVATIEEKPCPSSTSASE